MIYGEIIYYLFLVANSLFSSYRHVRSYTASDFSILDSLCILEYGASMDYIKVDKYLVVRGDTFFPEINLCYLSMYWTILRIHIVCA